MPDGFGGGGEGAGGGSQGMGGLGGGEGGGNGGNYGNRGDPAQQQQAAAEARAEAQAQAQAAADAASPLAVMAQGFQSTPENQRAIANSAMAQGFQSTPENQRAIANDAIVREFLANVAADKQTALAKPGETGVLGYNPNVGTNVLNAADVAKASGLSNFTTQIGGGKNVGGPRDVTVQTTGIPIASLLGYSGAPGDDGISYAEAKRLQDLGLGNLTGVYFGNMPGAGLSVLDRDGNVVQGLTYNNPGQTADSVVAAQDFSDFATKAIDIAKNFIPGFGLIQFAADLLSGKTTLGQALMGILGDRAASAVGVSPPVFRALANGDYGNGLAAWANSALNSYVSKAANVDPRVTGTLMNVTGLSNVARQAASPLNVGPNISGTLAGAVDAGLGNLGIGKGPATSSANVPYLGADRQTQVENIINPGQINRTDAPVSLDTSSTPLSSVNTSSTPTYSGGLPSMANLGPAGGLYRISGTGYTPYQQNLAQLNLPADPFTKASDLGNIPVYNTDIAKMASAPFTNPFDPFTQYAAEGGSIRRFSGEEGSHVTADAEPTPEQLEQRAALQAQAQYYKDKEAQAQNADIMASLKSLAGIGSEMAPPKPQLLHLGQVGNYTPPKVLPQLAALLQARGMRLAEGGQPDDHRHPHYDGTPVFRTGGLEGLGGKYVQGKGDGTSDDITAMLADGEYVLSADVVSALGNGSNKAGAQVLDKTVQAIRSRARSTAPDKLPPDAKSPLEYIQSVKGKKHG